MTMKISNSNRDKNAEVSGSKFVGWGQTAGTRQSEAQTQLLCTQYVHLLPLCHAAALVPRH